MTRTFRQVAQAIILTLLPCTYALAQTNKPVWDLHTLGDAPQWINLERPASGSSAIKPIFFTGLPFRGKPTRVFAWLGIPHLKPGEKAPGVVLVHGGGGTAFEEWVQLWVQRGYAAIAMDTCGQVPVGNNAQWVHDEQGGPPGWGGFDQIDWPLADQWTYHAVADVILAHSLLRSLPEVDPARIGVTGISWGGYLTSLVAGVDPRFKFAVPVYGCGFYLDTIFADELNKLTPEQRDRWMRWWDPSMYLPDAAMPFLWVTGATDHFYPLVALQKSYQSTRGARTLSIRVQMPHGHGPGEQPEEIRVFADSLFKGGPPLPRITAQGADGSKVWAGYTADVAIVKAELNYTKDAGRWQDRKWESQSADLSQTRVTATLPAGTRVYYLNLFDARGVVVSTEHQTCNVP